MSSLPSTHAFFAALQRIFSAGLAELRIDANLSSFICGPAQKNEEQLWAPVKYATSAINSRLRSLDMSLFSDDDNSTVVMLLQKLTGLHRLALGHEEVMSRRTKFRMLPQFAAALGILTALTELRITAADDTDGRGLTAAVAAMTQLRCLHHDVCPSQHRATVDLPSVL